MKKETVEIEGCAWSICTNEKVLALGLSNTLVICDLKTLKVHKKIQTHQETEIYGVTEISRDSIRRCEFMGETDTIGVGYFNGLCDIIDIEKGKVLDRLEGDESEVKSVCFNGSNRFAFSTREGSIWVWKMSDEKEWEIEEIVEYSESDVKSILWHGNRLISVGYTNEIVIYSRWEDEMCDVKWEIESIFKSESCAWDISVVEDGSFTYVAVVTQDGSIIIYSKEKETDLFTEKERVKASEYPIISVTDCMVDGKGCLAMIINRKRLVVYKVSAEGLSILFEEDILSEYEEPVDIIYSKTEDALFVLSMSVQKQKRLTHLHKIDMKNSKLFI